MDLSHMILVQTSTCSRN